MKRLQHGIADIVSGIDGLVGVCIHDIESGEKIGVGADLLLPMASVCKIPILVAAYRAAEQGSLNLSKRIELSEETRCFGSGLFNHFGTGLRPTFHDLLLMMIVVSDNAATDIVLNKLTLPEVNRSMHDLGNDAIRIDRTIRELLSDWFSAMDKRLADVKYGELEELFDGDADLKAKCENLDECRRAVNEIASDRDVASPESIARLCAQIARNEAASSDSCDAMLKILEEQQLNGRLPRDLPPFTKFPHKTGTLGNGAVVNDAGILYRNKTPVAAVAVLSRDVRTPIHETNSKITQIGRAVYEHYFI